MAETDWREILSFSQRDLIQADKEKLCESLSWMEADDIELNFTDLKTLFRLAQDILKHKSEQVNNLLGQIETSQRKGSKGNGKGLYMESPTKGSDTPLETIAHQEEVIKANKEILEQLYADIAELGGRKNKLEKDRNNEERDSESSRDALSEMNAVVQLENDVAMKNRHIRKLLSDIKILEEENTRFKEKVSVLKEKLTEATQLIDNLTEQILHINKETSQLKEMLGKSELAKSQLSVEIEYLRKDMFEKESKRTNSYEEIQSKVQHWKNIARSKKAEIKALTTENAILKEDLIESSRLTSSPKSIELRKEELKMKELQDKLSEASYEIEQSANLINLLRTENKQLKSIIEEAPDYTTSITKNESDDGKERIMINKLKAKVNHLTVALQAAEEMVTEREKELTEVNSQLQLLQTNDGINALFEGLKNKKRQLRFKDEGIKSLVREVNSLSQLVNDLQLENETLRQEFNISADENIPTTGIMKKYHDMEQKNKEIVKELKILENKAVFLELENHNMKSKIVKMTLALENFGYKDTVYDDAEDDPMPNDGGGESSTYIAKRALKNTQETNGDIYEEPKMEALVEENEGRRKGLQEILIYLKDNSTSSSGILTLQCPSLDTILQAMEARHSAGWFAPHMITVMQLREALGGKDALITALHDARKETFDVMTQLSKEAQKTSELEQKLNDIEIKNKQKELKEKASSTTNMNMCEFGSWISEKEQININFYDKSEIDNIIVKGNSLYEGQLKKGLEYFHSRFKTLFDKMTDMIMQATDDRNKWDIQEEQYRAEIENLKSQLTEIDDEDISDSSPGLTFIPSVTSLQRKCSYLEESYKYIRTLNENMKNEYLESKKDAMIMSSEYEAQIQKLILSVANLTDKLRCCISIELFWKQNVALNEYISKYRKLVQDGVCYQSKSLDLLELMERDKIDIINYFEKQLEQNLSKPDQCNTKELLSKVEQSILQKQVEQVCSELEDRNKKIEQSEKKNLELQETQINIIDQTLASITKEDVELMKNQMLKFAEENKILKEQCKHVRNQLDIALLQLQDKQHRQMSNDMEINILRHQIIDLQSTDDSKAIVARLGGEVLVAHLQASECHMKIDRLNSSLYKEKELRAEAEEMLKARQKIFEVYSLRYESKFRYMYEIMQILRQQYQGSLPLASLENYLNKTEELNRNNQAVNEKLYEIEDLQSSLMTKHSVYDQILDLSKNKCLIEEDSCAHKLKYVMMQSTHSREIDHINKKLKALEQSEEELIKHCNYLEKTLVLVNQGLEKSSLNGIRDNRNSDGEISVSNLELEDVHSGDESSTRRSQTITLPRPKVLQPQKKNLETTNFRETITEPEPKPPVQINQKIPKLASVSIQTVLTEILKKDKISQTEDDKQISELRLILNSHENNIRSKNKEISEAIKLAQQCTKDCLVLNTEKSNLEYTVNQLKDSNEQKNVVNDRLQITIDELRKQLGDIKASQTADRNNKKEIAIEENKSLLHALKRLEDDKNDIVKEYNNLLTNEREEYAKAMKGMHAKITELQTNLDRRGSDSNVSNPDSLREIINKYTMKTTELEDKCFKLQSELDECKTEVTTYQSESERWKSLASERLTKMEHLNSQLKERHCHEVESYKAENQHWLTQLSDTQREHMELRSRLTEQKAFYVKQLADKDSQIEQLRSIVHNLKTQIMNMQTMISVNDPSFDLSAIVEVDEASDGLSQHGSDRLELKFDSTGDLHDMHDDIVRMPSTSSAIWQEPVIERLRREKQMASKQNIILRRQIKALAARERRSRLDAQNLKNQVFRINTSSTKVTTVETAALQHKIASLQAQLTSARHDTESSIALWDKWKRAQQASERWQARYSEKCHEVTKLESGLNLAKSALSRLEKEKRVLLSRLSEVKHESQLAIEKQDTESLEKSHNPNMECVCMKSPPVVSSRALLERVQAQQRRIAALEVAEKGNEFLVSEYEKSLAEITSLKGQVLKLESTLLESQIRSPLKTSNDSQPELEYFKSYCEMLKDENVQLTLKVNTLETTPSTTNHHRINDLEQTVLTLRGIISKLQSEQKSSGVHKKIDSRPSSGRSSTDKVRNQTESHRTEILNLKRSMQEKDLLLERSKEMLKIAAEREDELLRVNEFLRHRLDEMDSKHGGFLSV